MNVTVWNHTIPDFSRDVKTHFFGGGGGDFPAFYPKGGSSFSELIPTIFIGRGELLQKIFDSVMQILFSEKSAVSEKDSLVRELCMPTHFPISTFSVYPVTERERRIVPSLHATGLLFLYKRIIEGGESNPEENTDLRRGWEHFKRQVLQGHEELRIIDDLLTGTVQEFYQKTTEMASVAVPSISFVNPFDPEILKVICSEVKKIREGDLLLAAKAFRERIPTIPDVDIRNLQEWLRIPENQQLLANLEIGELAGLGLRTVPKELLQYCSDLSVLDLSGNKIALLWKDSLFGLKGLRYLLFSSNEIVSVPEGLFEPLPILVSVNFLGNPVLSGRGEPAEELRKLQRSGRLLEGIPFVPPVREENAGGGPLRRWMVNWHRFLFFVRRSLGGLFRDRLE